MTRILYSVLVLGGTVWTSATSQEYRPGEYYRFLPPTPNIVTQTEASVRFRLFGDTTHGRDIRPRDGIDDSRAARLLDIAERFSPVLHKGSFSLPRDIEEMLAYRYDEAHESVTCNEHVYLYVDTWRRETPVPFREAADRIDLGPSQQASQCAGMAQKQAPPAPDDSLLQSLLYRLDPRKRHITVDAAQGDRDTVLWFDFPGTGEKMWRRIHRRLEDIDTRIYTHPFIYEHENTVGDEHKYEFVMQYWFFYPWNDGGNNHEGDWEHINVSITTRTRAAISRGEQRLLDSADVTLIVDGTLPLDQLVINVVDYYFHHFSVTADYKPYYAGNCHAPDVVYNTDLARRFGYTSASLSRHSRPNMCRIVSDRITETNGLLETHPVAYIGADNIGPDQLIGAIGHRNQDSHGTYPYPGLWRDVGPFGATERVNGRVVPPVRLGTVVPTPDLAPHESRFRQHDFFVYKRESITLLPDWERIVEDVQADPAVRRQWAWLILPIRWGFPTTKSPGAGLFERVDLGNASPVGPTFNRAWNRIGEEGGYTRYEATPLFAGFQLSPWDNFRNSWGPANAIVLLTGAPVINLIWAGLYSGVKLVAPGAVADRWYLPGLKPNRRFEIHSGATWRWGGEKILATVPGLDTVSQLRNDIEGVQGTPFREAEWALQASYIFHYSDRWMNETVFSGTDVPRAFLPYSQVGYPIMVNDTVVGQIQGRLKLRNVHGAFRFNTGFPFRNVAQISIRGGYGWTWHSVTDLQLVRAGADGSQTVEDLVGLEGHGGRSPVGFLGFLPRLPNTLLFGAGAELLLPKSALAGILRLGARVDLTHYHTAGFGGRHALWLALIGGI